MNPSDRLLAANLGDIVVLPDGRHLTVRSRVQLPMTLGAMAGFMVLGELEALLSLPPDGVTDTTVYHPTHLDTDTARRTQVIFEGVANYWSPHLPAVRQAMGELGFKVADLAGQLDPLVVVYRSGEPVAFIRAACAPGGSLGVLHMPCVAEDVSDVARHAGIVTSPQRPAARPAEQPAPVREPVAARARSRR